MRWILSAVSNGVESSPINLGNILACKEHYECVAEDIRIKNNENKRAKKERDKNTYIVSYPNPKIITQVLNQP